jgi:antitoxin SocA-like protein
MKNKIGMGNAMNRKPPSVLYFCPRVRYYNGIATLTSGGLQWIAPKPDLFESGCMMMLKVSERTPNDQKLRELILLICERSEGDDTFGATKLNKLLFYSDFLSFLNLGEAITWHRYQKIDFGPAPRALVPILKKMESDREVAFASRSYFGKSQRRTLALREPKLDLFTAEEVDLVDRLICHFWKSNASELSGLSHKFIGWQLAAEGEDIPYEVALLSPAKPTDAVLKRAAELESLAEECLSRNNG